MLHFPFVLLISSRCSPFQSKHQSLPPCMSKSTNDSRPQKQEARVEEERCRLVLVPEGDLSDCHPVFLPMTPQSAARQRSPKVAEDVEKQSAAREQPTAALPPSEFFVGSTSLGRQSPELYHVLGKTARCSRAQIVLSVYAVPMSSGHDYKQQSCTQLTLGGDGDEMTYTVTVTCAGRQPSRISRLGQAAELIPPRTTAILGLHDMVEVLPDVCPLRLCVLPPGVPPPRSVSNIISLVASTFMRSTATPQVPLGNLFGGHSAPDLSRSQDNRNRIAGEIGVKRPRQSESEEEVIICQPAFKDHTGASSTSPSKEVTLRRQARSSSGPFRMDDALAVLEEGGAIEEQSLQGLLDKAPLGRWQLPEDVAPRYGRPPGFTLKTRAETDGKKPIPVESQVVYFEHL